MKRTFVFTILACLALACMTQEVHFIKTGAWETGYASFVFSLDDQGMKTQLASAPLETDVNKGDSKTITLPLPGGEPAVFEVVEAPVMARELADRYPDIKTYKVQGNGMNGRIGYTDKGFHGIIFTPQGSVYIDPIGNQPGIYHSYFRRDYMAFYEWTKGHACLLEDDPSQLPVIPEHYRGSKRSGEQMRKYMLALACTGEYAQFHGGTVSGALSAMVVTMNRVNGVYERELAVTMELVSNNDDLIFLDGSSDPYSNNSGGTMLGQNQNTVTSVIGSANYDVGHVFSTGGGGIANLGCVCTSNSKARGVTGSSSPTGDPFDIDYVAHEMGHQFGGEHTFNGTGGSCSGNRESSSAYEPGSGSTIMAYAGICGSQDNLQSNSDDYFHAHSLDQMLFFTEDGNGNTCATITNTGNNAPTANAGNGGFTIPKETPFLLTGSGSDMNGDVLTYCWEQMDLGPAGQPATPSDDAPIFRSWEPTTRTTRTCPRMVNVIIGNTVIGETYATYSREMNFRLTVRDNNSAGGGMGYDEMSFDVDGNSGPFEVTSPAAGQQVQAGNGFEVTWDVAGTDGPPVNCDVVVIELCVYTSGDMTVLEVLANNTPNDGSEVVTISQSFAGGGRYIRVRAGDNIFFNINGGSFSVVLPTVLNNNLGIPLTATPDYINSLVQLNWNDSFTNESAFVIERSLNGNQSFTMIDTVPANTTVYNDSSAAMYGENFYRVYAVNSISQSAFSNEATYPGLGIPEPDQAEAVLYPNPANDRLFIEAPWFLFEKQVNILDAQGRVVQTLEMFPVIHKQAIGLTHLAPGQYWMQLNAVNGGKSAVPFQVAR